MIGTIPYISPEQADGNPDHIDTRTDVYGLGIILYELLTGGLPYPSDGSVLEAVRNIVEMDPAPLRVTWAENIGAEHPQAPCRIDKELEYVVLKAIAKEPGRRYQSVEQLAADLRRYISGDPIDARRDSGWYVLRKTIARHRSLIAMCLAIGFLAIGLTLTAVYAWSMKEQAEHATVQERAQAKRARDAQALAEQKEQDAVAVYSFLDQLLSSVNPDEDGRADASIQGVLSDAVRQLESKTTDPPEVRARLFLTIGKSFSGLGDVVRAHGALQEAAVLFKQADGHHSVRAAEAQYYDATLCMWSSQHFSGNECLENVRSAKRIYQFHDDTEMTLAAGILESKLLWESGQSTGFKVFSMTLSPVLFGEFTDDEAPGFTRPYFVEMRQAWEKGEVERTIQLAWEWRVRIIHEINRLTMGGQGKQAMSLVKAHFEPCLKRPAWRHVVVNALCDHAVWTRRQGDPTAASATMIRVALQIAEDQFPNTVAHAKSLCEWGEQLLEMEEYDAAVVALEEGVRIGHPIAGDQNVNILIGMINLGEALAAQGKYDDAVKLCLSIVKWLSGDNSDTQYVLRVRMALARAYIGQGRLEYAADVLDAARSQISRGVGGRWMSQVFEVNEAALLVAQDKWAEAEAVLLDSIAKSGGRSLAVSDVLPRGHRLLIKIYQAQGRKNSAEQWAERYDSLEAVKLRKALDPAGSGGD